MQHSLAALVPSRSPQGQGFHYEASHHASADPLYRSAAALNVPFNVPQISSPRLDRPNPTFREYPVEPQPRSILKSVINLANYRILNFIDPLFARCH